MNNCLMGTRHAVSASAPSVDGGSPGLTCAYQGQRHALAAGVVQSTRRAPGPGTAIAAVVGCGEPPPPGKQEADHQKGCAARRQLPRQRPGPDAQRQTAAAVDDPDWCHLVPLRDTKTPRERSIARASTPSGRSAVLPRARRSWRVRGTADAVGGGIGRRLCALRARGGGTPPPPFRERTRRAGAFLEDNLRCARGRPRMAAERGTRGEDSAQLRPQPGDGKRQPLQRAIPDYPPAARASTETELVERRLAAEAGPPLGTRRAADGRAAGADAARNARCHRPAQPPPLAGKSAAAGGHEGARGARRPHGRQG